MTSHLLSFGTSRHLVGCHWCGSVGQVTLEYSGSMASSVLRMWRYRQLQVTGTHFYKYSLNLLTKQCINHRVTKHSSLHWEDKSFILDKLLRYGLYRLVASFNSRHFTWLRCVNYKLKLSIFSNIYQNLLHYFISLISTLCYIIAYIHKMPSHFVF